MKMDSRLLGLFLGLLLVAAPLPAKAGGGGGDDADVDEKDVVVLTEKNFDKIVKKSKFALVEFYAPWCGHCKSLKPHYAKAATELKEYDASIVIGKVDATEEKDLGSKFEVKGYPTLKWFVDGELHSDYNGGRDAAGIVSWIKKKTGPVTTKIDTAAALADKEKASAVLAVGFFSKLEGAEYDAFKSVATKTEDVVFIETTDAAVAKAAGIDGKAPAIALVKNYPSEARETVAAPAATKFEAEALTAFINGDKLPLSLEFNSDNSERIFKSGIDKHVIIWGKADQLKEGADVFKAFRAVAKEFKGKLMFVTANNEGDAAEPITNYFGLKENSSPQVVGFFAEKNKKYKFGADEVTEATIREFATKVNDGTAEVDYKSAPIPSEPKEEGVTIVVGKNFNDVVLDKTKDVLLEIYAPWCGHCKALAPTWVKLAKRFESISSVVIAKMDGTENEHPEAEAKGFPTLLFFPAGEDSKPIPYDSGDRSLKALTKFIKKHAKVAYELPKKEKKTEEAAAEETKAEEKKEAKDEL